MEFKLVLLIDLKQLIPFQKEKEEKNIYMYTCILLFYYYYLYK